MRRRSTSWTDLQYLLHSTYSMEQSPPWEANWFSASQEIPCILRSSKVHYRINNSPPSIPILSQINPVRTPQPTSRKYILILSFHLRLVLWNHFFPSDFPSKTLYMPLLSPYVLHAPPIFLLYLIIRTILVEEYQSLSSTLRSLFHSHLTSSPLAQISPTTPYSRTPSAQIPPSM